jgi:hypothetical protein
MNRAAAKEAYEKEQNALKYNLDLRGVELNEAERKDALAEQSWQENKPVVVDGSLVNPKTGKVIYSSYDAQGKVPKHMEARYKELIKGSQSRRSQLDSIMKMETAFASGADSGFSRSVIGLIPGEHTGQGRFEEVLEKMAIEAARTSLKGDATKSEKDVALALQANVGKGRSEEFNKHTLMELRRQLVDEENELRRMQGQPELVVPDIKGLTREDGTSLDVGGDDWFEAIYGTDAPTRAAQIDWEGQMAPRAPQAPSAPALSPSAAKYLGVQ